jgi:murein DD-endopeptidase MepM/ murein hydrolase activator NlpD
MRESRQPAHAVIELGIVQISIRVVRTLPSRYLRNGRSTWDFSMAARSGKHSSTQLRHQAQPLAIPSPQKQSPRKHSLRKPSFRKLVASAGTMLVVIGLAATMAIPATSAAASQSQSSISASAAVPAQSLKVNSSVLDEPVSWDNTSVTVAPPKVILTAPQPGPGGTSVGGWANPIDRPITSPWGPRTVICTSGVGCDSGFHAGDDFGAPCNTPFYSVSAGVVTSITYAGLAGDEIVVTHAGGISTAYAHMYNSGILVTVGEQVTAGQNIGLTGSTGDSTGCHLYFEYRVNGVTVDPQPAMAAHGIILGT